MTESNVDFILKTTITLELEAVCGLPPAGGDKLKIICIQLFIGEYMKYLKITFEHFKFAFFYYFNV